MNSPASDVTRAITDYLEQHEKQHIEQQSSQDKHGKLLETLQTSIENLKIKCEDISKENLSLKEELEARKLHDEQVYKQIEAKCDQLAKENGILREELKNHEKREEQTQRNIHSTKLNVDKLLSRLEKFESWTELTTAIATQIKSLNEDRDAYNDKLNEFAKHIRRLQSGSRIPTRSPSASSYLNGNTHSSLPRFKPGYHKSNLLIESQDPDDDISEISDHAERIKRDLEELHRSFEKHSFYSDD